MLCPQQRRFSAHWSMVEDGAVPAGNFGRYMARNCCTDILGDRTPPRTQDKLWKLRPAVDKLHQRFFAGRSLPTVFRFDANVLSSTCRRNTTLMFMPDKTYRYGSKMFMTCDPRNAYFHRFEMYAGKRRHDNRARFASNRHPWHVSVVDRFYTSMPLCVELLAMNIYIIGTVMINRLGLNPPVKEKGATRPVSIPRVSFKFARSVAIPSMVMLHWWDRKPVHYMCTGAVMSGSSINRNAKQVGPISVGCPGAVTDYQRWMGSVDVHDQLRLQKYSFQTSTKFIKYYKSLFFAL
ncbi:Hypothetical protein PHPALM_19659 [Phytophthora palmivora]|uniref:PiggyBac transposable element-derived protein domain-containing protein n=1 Tax=Phytophthora palmivora TaxID=4796 RepID=A0A2P4XGV4_9STRA|nr:Hypothetical protein PHPALM_19659 [Phytophthora palmivora]